MRREHPLFLRWALLNSLTISGAVALSLGFVRHIHGAPLVVAAVVVAGTAVASAYAGRLFWDADLGGEPDSILHDAHHLDATIYAFQVLAALGAILGVYLTASAHAASSQEAAIRITDAMANGLLATFTGIVCSLFLFAQHHLLLHKLDRPGA